MNKNSKFRWVGSPCKIRVVNHPCYGVFNLNGMNHDYPSASSGRSSQPELLGESGVDLWSGTAPRGIPAPSAYALLIFRIQRFSKLFNAFVGYSQLSSFLRD